MGWNTLELQREDALLAGLRNSDRFYFVHSFAAPINGCLLASVHYGEARCAIVRQHNFHGVQFHPERSSAAGARILRNFLELPTCC
jgi:glutamine amidotransferase